MKEINKIRFTHLSGLPNVPKSGEVSIILYDGQITFRQASLVSGQEKEEMGESYVSLDQLVSGGLISNLEAEANSTIKSAIVGGILFGGTGAIVGALVGNEKKKTIVEHYFLLNYKSSVDGSVQSIYFSPFPESKRNYMRFMEDIVSVAPNFINTDALPDRYAPVHL